MVKGHHFINDYTELTSYCLGNYEEIKDITDCDKICKKFNDQHMKGNDIFIKAFLIFKVFIDKVGKLTIPMGLTHETLQTQFYDNVEGYKTLEYNKNELHIRTCRNI